jgi:hypothetical protein
VETERAIVEEVMEAPRAKSVERSVLGPGHLVVMSTWKLVEAKDGRA